MLHFFLRDIQYLKKKCKTFSQKLYKYVFSVILAVRPMLGRDLAASLLLLPPCLFAQTVVFNTLTPGITCGITSAKLVE